MTETFTLDGYRSLVSQFLERGYRATGYDRAKSSERHLILRHDLDFSLNAALPIAEIERDLDVAAHYFVLVRSEIYNLFSGAAQNVLGTLTSLGHEIGLHLDASLYGDDLDVLDAAARRECSILEEAISSPVRMISFHRPAKILLGLDRPLAGRPHTYQPAYFEAFGYCSDSRGAWKHGYPLDHEAVRAGRSLQLLTHPIWWNGNEEMEPVARLDAFIDASQTRLRKVVADNSEPYREAMRQRDDDQ